MTPRVRIEFIASDGIISVAEREAPPLLHAQDALSIQMALASMLGRMIPALADSIVARFGGPAHVNAPQCECALCDLVRKGDE